MPTDEFDRRLVNKLRDCTKETLIGYLLAIGYEEMCQAFDGEILNEWEAEQETDE